MTARVFALALVVAVSLGASCAHSDARITAVARGRR